jgi:predicted RNase H-like HicB family nuclease
MTDLQKKRKEWKDVTGLPVVTELVDARPRRRVQYLHDYTLLSTTADFSAGHAEVTHGPSPSSQVHVQINRLTKNNLKAPLDVLVDPEERGFVARTPDLPLVGYGKDRIEAIDMLKNEIESLFEELREDDVSEEWLGIKKFLTERITANQ